MTTDPRARWLRQYSQMARGIVAHFRDAVRSHAADGDPVARDSAVMLSLRAAERLANELVKQIPRCPR